MAYVNIVGAVGSDWNGYISSMVSDNEGWYGAGIIGLPTTIGLRIFHVKMVVFLKTYT